ncbi:agamous-like MADS-box protein AGL80 [Vicia villosa]|uniref:agamous-like MADS-box protein AGL80 n=1 Tax=Vicia villosa TaxID=3911 RepID=UPI00273C31F6|nr:agamous-like MADS-box protein AGL80 [Vicia villosa]
MTRKKVKLAFIENDTARKTTYKKRTKGLLKKVEELSTLCGIDACAIVYGPYDPQPEIWPSPSGVEKVLLKFKAAPEFDQSRRMVDLESFLKHRISKAEKQLKRQWADNKETETTMLMFQCLNAGNVEQNDMSMDVLNDLSCMIDHNLRKIGRRIESGDSENINHQNPIESQVMAAQSQSQVQLPMAPPPPLLPPPPPPPTVPDNDVIEMMSRLGWV